jgi:hypothetical protein
MTPPRRTDSVAPERSLEQRFAALKRANHIRSARAVLKRELGAGSITMASLMDADDCATMKVIDALLAMPKVGRIKAHRALTMARISPSKTLSGLTVRQRRELLALLPDAPAPSPQVVVVPAAVAPIHQVPQPKQRGRRQRGLDDLLADVRGAR